MLKTALIIGFGGGLGSILRYFTSVLVSKYWSSNFPLATFIVNSMGCLLIGFIIGLLEKNQLSDSRLKWFLVTGICGGLTTFSTFGMENYNLFQNNNSLLAFVYIAMSVIIGLLAIWFGIFLSK
jgi:CrcB protein